LLTSPQAVAIIDRQILTADAMRVTEIENARREMQTVCDMSTMNKFGLREEEEEPVNQQQLRKGYLGGLGKAAGVDKKAGESAKPCTFSGHYFSYLKTILVFYFIFVILPFVRDTLIFSVVVVCREHCGSDDRH
jgi:hypothetical protein